MTATKKLNYCFLILLLTLGAALVGCSGRRSGTMTPEEGAAAGAGLSESELDARRESRFGGGRIPTAEGEGLFRDVHFEFDSSAITDQARQEIEYNRRVLESNDDLKLQLEGHCDERGTAQYNMALGQRRARAVYDMLVSLGIDPARLDTISYGAEVPLDSASNEDAWAKNRRVHFSPFTGQ